MELNQLSREYSALWLGQVAFSDNLTNESLVMITPTDAIMLFNQISMWKFTKTSTNRILTSWTYFIDV